MIYKHEFAEEAGEMCQLGATDEELAGATDEELAEHYGVSVRTIYRWRHTYVTFAEAVVAGKKFADDRVERALYSRAVGCSVQRTKVFRTAADPDPVYATYTDHLPPDTQAALHWLRVRQPKKWGVRKEPFSRTIEEAWNDPDWDEDNWGDDEWDEAFIRRMCQTLRESGERRSAQQSPQPPSASSARVAPPPPPPPPAPPRPTAAAPQPAPARRPQPEAARAPSGVHASSASRPTPASGATPAMDDAPAPPPKGVTPHPDLQICPEPARLLVEDPPSDPHPDDPPGSATPAPPHENPGSPPRTAPPPPPAPAPLPRPLFELFSRNGGGYGPPPTTGS